MHHTHLVSDEEYVPKNDTEAAIFKEMQTFMYAVLEDHLKTDKGKSLVSHYEAMRDAQSIYRDLKKHALSSTAAQLLTSINEVSPSETTQNTQSTPLRTDLEASSH